MDPTSRGRRNWLLALLATTFRSLRHRDYRLYFAGQAVSFTGSWVQTPALQWSVFEATRDPLWPPLIMIGTVAPTILLGPLGGALADRLPKRPLIVGCQAVFLLNAAVLAVVVWGAKANPFVLLALAAVNGVVNAVDLPARLAYVPGLIPRDDLINAVGLNSLLFNLGRAVGPAVSGGLFLLLRAFAGPAPEADLSRLWAAGCFALNAVSYAAVIAGLLLMRPADGARRREGGRLVDGFAFVARRPTLAALLLCTGALSLFGWPMLTLFPAYTANVLGHDASEYSWLVSMMGVGALVAALGNAAFGSLARARLSVVVGSALTAAAVIGLALSNVWAVAAVAAGVFGTGMILFLSTGQSVLQLSTPDHARGRVMALWPMTLSGGTVVGNLVFGWAASRYPLPQVLGVMAAGTALTAGVVATLAVGLRPAAEAGAAPTDGPPPG